MYRYGPAVCALLGWALLVPSLTDPLEGGITLLLATAFLLIARLWSTVHLPRLTWIPITVAFVLGVLVLVLALTGLKQGPFFMVIRVGLWAYRAALLVAIVGGFSYVLAVIRRGRSLTGR